MNKLLICVVVFIAVIWFFFNFKNNDQQIKQVKIGENILNVEVVDTNAERELGLSGRSELATSTGLLFVFENEGKYGFWMKDMNFPIDIVWLDRNKKIVHVESNVLPESYPKIFFPQELSLYVLEVSAGFLNENNIKIGDFVDF